MKKKILLLLALVCGMQTWALELVVHRYTGVEMVQDIAVIGKCAYVGDVMQLLAHDGTLLASEHVANIRKITFEEVISDIPSVEKEENTIRVYPNPTQDQLILSGIEAQLVRVFDMQGRIVKTANGVSIDVRDLSAGTYLLQVGTQVVRFIKR